MKKAFTLIELLVVIAIIAILAAILFPVFAQAKSAAKASASISNAKQLALGIIMYGDSSDDTMPIAGNFSAAKGIKLGTAVVSTWAYSVQPYMKNGKILDDPTGTSTPNAIAYTVLPDNIQAAGVDAQAFFPQYGYNYSALSPVNSSGIQTPVSQTAPAAPADTILLTSKFGITEAASDAAEKSGLITPYWAEVEAPICGTVNAACRVDWRTAFGLGVTKPEAGANTGGVSSHASNSAIVAFVDGHVKKMKLSALTAGTNVTVDDKGVTGGNATPNADFATKYLWDIQ